MSLAEVDRIGHVDVTKRVKNWIDERRLARVSEPPSLFPELGPVPAPAPATAPQRRLHLPDFEPVRQHAPRPFGCQTQAQEFLSQGESPTPLVSSAISHHASQKRRAREDKKFWGIPSISRIEIYPHSVKVCKVAKDRPKHQGESSKRGEIDGFSSKSQTRLRRRASECRKDLTSMFTLTYHENIPDGKTAKKQLDRMLTYMRRQFEEFKYLWIHEFQTRGAPHFHIFCNQPPNKEIQRDLAKKWCQITNESIEVDGKGDVIGEAADQYHVHCRRKAWIDWEMGSGAYVAKYLDKEYQKNIPEDYGWSGRFWGNSRGLMPKPAVFDAYDLCALLMDDYWTVDRSNARSKLNRLVRDLGGWLRSRQRKYSSKKFKQLNALKQSRWVQDGAAAFWKIVDYMMSENEGPFCDELLTDRRYDYSREYLFTRPNLP